MLLARRFIRDVGDGASKLSRPLAVSGMVVGLYGILYAYAALRLDRAKLIIAIGPAGKILGPIGMFFAVRLARGTAHFGTLAWAARSAHWHGQSGQAVLL